MDDSAREDFRTYVAARSPVLLRTAYLLTGSRADAEDLLQTALAKTYLAWDRIRDREAVDGYVRRVMVNSWTWSHPGPTAAAPPWTRRTWRPSPGSGPRRSAPRPTRSSSSRSTARSRNPRSSSGSCPPPSPRRARRWSTAWPRARRPVRRSGPGPPWLVAPSRWSCRCRATGSSCPCWWWRHRRPGPSSTRPTAGTSAP